MRLRGIEFLKHSHALGFVLLPPNRAREFVCYSSATSQKLVSCRVNRERFGNCGSGSFIYLRSFESRVRNVNFTSLFASAGACNHHSGIAAGRGSSARIRTEWNKPSHHIPELLCDRRLCCWRLGRGSPRRERLCPWNNQRSRQAATRSKWSTGFRAQRSLHRRGLSLLGNCRRQPIIFRREDSLLQWLCPPGNGAGKSECAIILECWRLFRLRAGIENDAHVSCRCSSLLAPGYRPGFINLRGNRCQWRVPVPFAG